MGKYSWSCVFLLLATVLYVSSQERKHISTNEAKLKAVMIYNFTKYIEWPSNVDLSLVNIGVNNSEALSLELKDLERKNNNIRVYDLDDVEYLEELHIIYSNDEEMLNKIDGKSILLVSDLPDKGLSMISFEGSTRQKFSVNDTLLKNHGLNLIRNK